MSDYFDYGGLPEIEDREFNGFENIYMRDLPDKTVAAALDRRDTLLESGTDLVLDRRFPYLDKDEQEHVLTHEYVHALNNEGKLYTALVNEGMNLEKAEKLSEMTDSHYRWAREGATELIALHLDPNGEELEGIAYPMEIEAVRSILDGETGNSVADDSLNYLNSGDGRYT